LDEIVSELRRQYEYVIFDTPPINVASDAGILGKAVGDALLIVRMNKTGRESVEEAIRLLHAANVKLPGIILTHHPKYDIPNYRYRYYS
jgi:Mrp family chromosome partitioning ATPase